MKQIITILFLFIGLNVFSQGSYSTISNRVLLNGVVNMDTFLVESIQNEVILNGITNQLEITFNNNNARTVSTIASSYGNERENIEILFHNEYLWIAERMKSDQVMVTLADEIYISHNGLEEKVPVNITITRIRGAQGFMQRIEISGAFNPNNLEMDVDQFDFIGLVYFDLQLTIQVIP